MSTDNEMTTAFLLTMEEAARRLRIGRTSLYGLLKSGAVKSVKVGGLRRIRPADLQAYVDSLKADADHQSTGTAA